MLRQKVVQLQERQESLEEKLEAYRGWLAQLEPAETEALPHGYVLQESLYGWQYGRLVGGVPIWNAVKFPSRADAIVAVDEAHRERST